MFVENTQISIGEHRWRMGRKRRRRKRKKKEEEEKEEDEEEVNVTNRYK